MHENDGSNGSNISHSEGQVIFDTSEPEGRESRVKAPVQAIQSNQKAKITDNLFQELSEPPEDLDEFSEGEIQLQR